MTWTIPMFKDFTFRDILYIAAILASGGVTAYRVQSLEAAIVDIKTKYVTIEANNLQHQIIELEITNAKLDRERQMLDLEMRLSKRGVR